MVDNVTPDPTVAPGTQVKGANEQVAPEAPVKLGKDSKDLPLLYDWTFAILLPTRTDRS